MGRNGWQSLVFRARLCGSPVDKSRGRQGQNRGLVWVPAEAGGLQQGWQAACRSSWPLLLDSDLAELVCPSGLRAWPPAPPPPPPPGRPRGDHELCFLAGSHSGASAKQGNGLWRRGTCDISSSLGIGQEETRAAGTQEAAQAHPSAGEALRYRSPSFRGEASPSIRNSDLFEES